ncbi:MAG: beta-ketoacyl-ACP synthase III [Planctomycetia bacterium]|jgi:3-oxoacyl-[acyl-carrier-protein] synthase-3
MTPKSDKPRLGSKPTQSRIGRLTGVRIAGVGGYVPEKLVLNEDLAEMGFDAEWIVQRTGIHERRHTEPGVGTNQLALEAAKRCIEDAAVSPEEIDLVIVATVTPSHLLPSTASFLQEELGLVAGTFDLNSACAGFGYAIITGSQFIATGSSKCVLVVGADCSSRFSPPEDRNYPLFGDGAGAVILKPGTEEQGLLGFAFGSDGSGRPYLYRPMGGSEMPFSPEGFAEGFHYLKMEGRAVFKWAVRTLETSVRQVLERAEVPLEDVNWCAFHQANMRIIDSAASSLGIGSERVVCNLAKYGNTTAASIPLILDELNRANKIKDGDLVLMSGFGAGLTWATMLMRW